MLINRSATAVSTRKTASTTRVTRPRRLTLDKGLRSTTVDSLLRALERDQTSPGFDTDGHPAATVRARFDYFVHNGGVRPARSSVSAFRASSMVATRISFRPGTGLSSASPQLAAGVRKTFAPSRL